MNLNMVIKILQLVVFFCHRPRDIASMNNFMCIRRIAIIVIVPTKLHIFH